MGKTLRELGVDHEYAPGMEPADPTLLELFWTWSQKFQFWDVADSAFVALSIVFFVLFFSACMAVARMLRLRSERRSAEEIEARKLARQRGVADARRRWEAAAQ